MSECVVRMEMPKACWFCGLRFVCKAANDFMTTKEAGCSVLKVGMEGCLIVCQLPEEHGRLGDLDELERKINGARIRAMQDGRDTNPYWECGDIIASEKTIVPADTERNDTK